MLELHFIRILKLKEVKFENLANYVNEFVSLIQNWILRGKMKMKLEV